MRIERRGTDHERYAFLAAGAAAYAELPVTRPGQPTATTRPDPVVRIDGGRSFGEVQVDLRAAVREALVPPGLSAGQEADLLARWRRRNGQPEQTAS